MLPPLWRCLESACLVSVPFAGSSASNPPLLRVCSGWLFEPPFLFSLTTLRFVDSAQGLTSNPRRPVRQASLFEDRCTVPLWTPHSVFSFPQRFGMLCSPLDASPAKLPPGLSNAYNFALFNALSFQ